MRFTLSPSTFWQPGCEYPLLPETPITEARWLPSVDWPYRKDGRQVFWDRGPEQVLEVRLLGQRRRPGLYWTANGASELLVNDGIRQLFERHQFTGGVYEPVVVHARSGAPAEETLWHLRPLVSLKVEPATEMTLEQLQEKMKSDTLERLPRGYRIVGDAIEDFCHLDSNPLILCVSSRVAELMLKERLANYVMERLDQRQIVGGWYSKSFFAQGFYALIDQGWSPDLAARHVQEGFSRYRGGAPPASAPWDFLHQLANTYRPEYFNTFEQVPSK